jgi:hypothetical protein
MKELRKLSQDNLVSLCIEKKWYTKGTIEEYDNMLNMTNKENLTTKDIAEIATDIKEYSNTEHEITNICFEIARICYSLFEVE